MTTAIQEKMFTTLGQFAALANFVGTRIYPDVAPQNVAKPYVVWNQEIEDPLNDLSGSTHSSGLKNYLIRCEAWAGTATAAREIDEQVQLAMAAATLFKTVLRDGFSLGFEQETKLFGMQSEFSVWLKV